MGNDLQRFHWENDVENAVALLRCVRAQQAADPGSKLSVSQGWAGPKTLFNQAACAPLADWIASLIPDKVSHIDGWGTIADRGDGVAPHDHVKSHRGGVNQWAGVYYLTNSDPLAWQADDGSTHWAAAHAGTCLLFPAHVVHWVPVITGLRIAIAFNIKTLSDG